MSVAFLCARSIPFPQVHGISARLLPLLAIRIDKKATHLSKSLKSIQVKCCCNSNYHTIEVSYEIPHVTLCSLDNTLTVHRLEEHVHVSLIFAIIVSFMLFNVFTLVCVLYFKEFLIHDSRGFMILKNN